jgi:hypothetical protein
MGVISENEGYDEMETIRLPVKQATDRSVSGGASGGVSGGVSGKHARESIGKSVRMETHTTPSQMKASGKLALDEIFNTSEPLSQGNSGSKQSPGRRKAAWFGGDDDNSSVSSSDSAMKMQPTGLADNLAHMFIHFDDFAGSPAGSTASSAFTSPFRTSKKVAQDGNGSAASAGAKPGDVGDVGGGGGGGGGIHTHAKSPKQKRLSEIFEDFAHEAADDRDDDDEGDDGDGGREKLPSTIR